MKLNELSYNELINVVEQALQLIKEKAYEAGYTQGVKDSEKE